MTKFLLILMLSLGMSSEGNSQSTKATRDTICFPIEQAKKVFTAAQQRDILLEKIRVLQNDIVLYQEEIENLDSTIATYKRDAQIDARIIQALEEQKDLLALNIVDYQRHIRNLEADVIKYQKRAKRNARLGLLGTAVGFGLGLFIAK